MQNSIIDQHKYCIVVIAVLMLVLGFVTQKPVESVEVVKHSVDTVTIVKTDTITTTKVVEVLKERVVVDTTYIYVNDTIKVPVPISRYHFFEKDKYDITARGYDVSLESVTVYPKTVYTTVTNTTEIIKTTDRWALYGGVGVWMCDKVWIPHMSLSAKTPKRWMFSVDLGIYQNNVLLGGTISYKITK